MRASSLHGCIYGVSKFDSYCPCSFSRFLTIGLLKSVKGKSIYWYDFKTFGSDPRRDRASQFAGIRTDEELNIIGEPLVIYCQPADDFLPDPVACLITGITPQKALAEGVSEVEFIQQIHREFSEPNTCVAGYNSIRFDDEVTRQLLYRNFYDPYEREWRNGNSRWDIIDMVRLCAATRPEGVNWPVKEDGSNSFRLDQLTVANGIEHADAHDALADVKATIELAKLIREKQPKLFQYVFDLRGKKRVQAQIDLVTRKPFVHVSMMYPAKLGCLALVTPICVHPTNSNGIIVYDLREDPESWMGKSVEEIRTHVYTPRNELPESVNRIPLKTIHINKCPVVASAGVLDEKRAREYEVDMDLCRRHWEVLRADNNVAKKIATVFRENLFEQETDPDYMIYSGGFFSDRDKSLMQTVRTCLPKDLARLDLPFADKRLHEMLLRYRARNYQETLSSEEKVQWEIFRMSRLNSESARARYNLSMAEAHDRSQFESDLGILSDLEQFVAALTTSQ